MYGILYNSNSLVFSLWGTDKLSFIPVAKTCAFFPFLQQGTIKKGECLLPIYFRNIA